MTAFFQRLAIAGATAFTLTASSAALAQTAAPAAAAAPVQAAAPVVEAPWPEAWFEIFKLAPGKQEAFIRRIARADEVAAAGGQPPIQIFVHEDGADWDVLLFKPVRNVKPTAAQQAAMDAKRKELHMESGPAYFVGIRENIAAHTDSKAYGPLSAAQWLAKLDKWRAENPEGEKK
ncbi:MAG: hypothetical protein WC729_16255 [Sphingomonas sp.]|jgi:hypothetical protein|uniref:hypothetical protein n=1 Tax=Sphingomonas sp. TaxID=28214 RepID=UPI003568AFCF